MITEIRKGWELEEGFKEIEGLGYKPQMCQDVHLQTGS